VFSQFFQAFIGKQVEFLLLKHHKKYFIFSIYYYYFLEIGISTFSNASKTTDNDGQ
jgi:hypothetical protein